MRFSMELRALLLLFLVAGTAGISFAAGDLDIGERFIRALCDLYNLFKSLLPIILIVAIAFAAVIMVGGQLLGAETRAKANSWAQSIVIYAIVAVIIIVLVPYLIKLIAPELDLERSCPGATSWFGGEEGA